MTGTVDIATLGIAIDTTQVKAATVEVEKLGEASLSMSDKVKTSNAAFNQLNDGLTSTEREAKKAKDAAAALELQQRALGETTTKLTLGQQQYMDKLRDMVSSSGLSKTALLEQQAAALGLTKDAYAPLIAQLEKATAAQGHHAAGMGSSLAKIEALRIGHDALIGSYTRMGSSMFVLGNATGWTTMLFSAQGAAILAVVGAVAGYFAALAAGKHEQEAFNNAIAITTNYAGISADHFDRLSHSMTNTKEITIGTANAILSTLVASGRIGGEAIEKIAKFSSDYAKSTGQDIEKIAPEMVKMFSDPAKGAEELNKSMHFLNTTELEHIATLERLGMVQEAQLALADKISEHVPKQAQNIGTITKLINEQADAWSKLGHNIMDQGKKKTYEQQQQDDQDQLSVWKVAGVGSSNENVKAVQAHFDALQPLVDAERSAAKAIKETASANKLQSDSWDALKKSSGAYHIQELQDRLELIQKHNSEPGDDFENQEGLKKNAIAQATKAIDEAQRALGAEQRAMATERINQEERLFEIKQKIAIDEINTQMKLGNIRKVIGESEINALQLQTIKAKENVEIQILALGGLSHAQRQMHEDKLAILKEEDSALEQSGANGRLVNEKAEYDEVVRAILNASTAEQSRLDSAIEKQRLHNDEIGKSVYQRDLAIANVEGLKLKEAESNAQYLRDMLASTALDEKSYSIYLLRLNALDKEIASRQKLAEFKAVGTALDVGEEQKRFDDKMLLDNMRSASNAAKTFEHDMTNSFGNVGKAIGKMTSAYVGYSVTAAKIERDRKNEVKAAEGDAVKIGAANEKASRDTAAAAVSSYASMADAAQGFFTQGSDGYKIMGEISKAFHMVEMAMAIQSMIINVTAAKTKNAANISTIPGSVASGAGQMFAQSGWGGFVGVAAMLAVMAALGFSGGSGGANMGMAQQHQATQGTGTVLGDSSAKSESLSKSLDDLKKNSDISLPISQEMLASLRNIESAMGGLAQIIFRTVSIQAGSGMGIATYDKNTLGRDLLGGNGKGIATNRNLDALAGGSIMNGVNLIASWWGKTKQDITDTGISINGKLSDISQGRGISQYANVHTESSSMFGLSKKSSDSIIHGVIDQTAADQIGKVFKGISDTLVSASATFTTDTSGIKKQIEDFVVDLPTISLQGLKGQALQDALNTVFSNFSDKLASTVLPGMEEFQKVGEGYFQTVIRIVNGVDAGRAALEHFGIAAINFKDIVNKQGDVAVELVRQSINAVEVAGTHNVHTDAYTTTKEEIQKQVSTSTFDWFDGLGNPIQMVAESFKEIKVAVDTLHPSTDTLVTDLTGVGKIIEAFDGSVSDLSKLYQELLDQRKLMDATGLNKMNLSAQTIQGSGGLSQLTSALSTYLDKYFTPQEKAIAAAKDVAASFKLIGETTPTTMAAFRAMVSGIDDSTDAGAKHLGEVLALAKPFSDTIQSLNDLVGSIKDTVTGLNAFKDSLLLGDLSPLTPEQKYAEAAAQYQKTLTSAQGGDLAAQSNLQAAATAFLEASRTVNASGDQYQSDFQSVLDAVSGITVAMQTQADYAQTVLASAGVAANQTTMPHTDMTILPINGSHANGLDYVPFDGYRAELHYGESVLTASENMNYRGMGAGANAALVAEIKALRAEIAALRTDQNEQTGALIKSNYDANDMAAEKIAISTKEAASDVSWSEKSKAVLI
jgi:phage-related minor tail protein